MTPSQQVFMARVKSFAWRLAGVALIAILNWISQEVIHWNLSPEWVTIIGLLVGELTKYLNTNLPWLRAQP